jgi:mycothiol synthase
MDRAGFPGWNMNEFEKWCLKILPDGFFFAIDSATGKLAATAMACHNPTSLHPFGATLSCVAVDPLHRGKGLGYVVSAAVTQRLLHAGYQDIYLETDDWRLAAIKTYLNMGWVPFLYRHDMPARWKKIYATLDLKYTPEPWNAHELTTESANANH